jgi:glycosyltransferase involved in cell wall biosynthesis
MKKILFYYPSIFIGGAEILFIRLANYFSKTNDYHAYVVDYPNGYLRQNVSSNVEIIDYDKRKELVLDNTIIISPLSMILSIDKNLPNVKGKFFFWGINPENLIDILKRAVKIKQTNTKNQDIIIKLSHFFSFRKIKKRFLDALKTNRVFFMDGANLQRSLSFFGIKKYRSNKLVPVPIIGKELEALSLKKNKIAWIGRLSHDKIYSLLYALKKMDDLAKATKEKIEFYIIGDGDSRSLLYHTKYNNIKVIEQGFLANDLLADFLLKNKIGLVFGMGTSILESSILKIPSILVDPSYSEIESDYCPKWAYEIEDYILGSFEKKTSTQSFERMYQNFLKDTDNRIGKKCFKYAHENHSLEKTASLLEYYFSF